MVFLQRPAIKSSRLIGFIGLLLGLVSGLLVGCSTPALLGQSEPPASQSFKLELAQHLDATGVKMYGTFWCPHCQHQKELFGEAVQALPYIECDPQGTNPQPQLCRSVGIQGYPTWEIDNQLYPGVRSLEELANLSRYPGEVPEDAGAL